MVEMEMVLMKVTLQQEQQDSWLWTPSSDEIYSVRTTYLHFLDPLVTELQPVFKLIWSKRIPSKVSALIWRVLLHRVQAKVNLRSWHIIQAEQNALCFFCRCVDKETNHLFFSFPLSYKVWSACYGWLSLSLSLPKRESLNILQSYFPSLNSS